LIGINLARPAFVNYQKRRTNKNGGISVVKGQLLEGSTVEIDDRGNGNSAGGQSFPERVITPVDKRHFVPVARVKAACLFLWQDTQQR
jgi:hypothetical protein